MWHYKRDGNEIGPVSADEIGALIRDGTLRARTEVFCQGMADWKPVQDTVLSSHLPPPEERDDIRFWRAHAPDYESDYKATFINGTASHPYGLPGIRCSVCGETWAGSRVLQHQCPAELQKELKSRWPVSECDFQALVARLQSVSPELAEVDLHPGDSLQPVQMRIPSRPEADFFWGTGTPVASDRVRRLLSRFASPGELAFAPVTFTKVGKRNAKLPPPIPRSGEPEDIIEEAAGGGAASDYFEMIVSAESGSPHGYVVRGECQGCGRHDVDSSSRSLVLHEDMWTGSPVFILATTLYVVVTDDVRRALIAAEATNVRFTPISA